MDAFADCLTCPNCRAEFAERARPEEVLDCSSCGARFPVVNGIPRFVPVEDDYAKNFGAQWHTFRTVQVDRLSGHDLSTSGFYEDTGWSPEWLRGKLVLDAGAGAGRYVDVMAEAGAKVIACDLSLAVDACRANMDDPLNASPGRGPVEIIQADLQNLPLKERSFDAVHCKGVIQHTADPAAVMRALARFVKPGGQLFYNFYEVDPFTRFQVFKYFMRRWTPHWSDTRLNGFCRFLCTLFFVPSLIMARIPVVRFFNRFLPICSVHPPGMSLRMQYVMTLLNTIDWYGPTYEQRQYHEQVAALLKEAGMTEVRSDPGRAWAIAPMS